MPRWPDVLVHQSDDDLAARLDFLGAAVDVGHPVERLLRRRDIVAHRREQDDRRADGAQIERLAGRAAHFARPELVADEQITRDPLDLFAVHQVIAAPPALELDKARRFRIDVVEHVVVLVPERVGRVQVLEVVHEMRAVELAVAKVGRQRREPRAAQNAAGIAHRIVRLAFAPRAAPVRHRRAVDHNGTGVVGRRAREHHCGPAALAVADDRRLRAVGMQCAHLPTNCCSAAHTSSKVWPGSGSWKNTTKYTGWPARSATPTCESSLKPPMPGPWPGARIDDQIRAASSSRRSTPSGGLIDSRRVVDGPLEMPAVEHDVIVEMQRGLESLRVSRSTNSCRARATCPRTGPSAAQNRPYSARHPMV